jgi:hypothetical protein
MNKTTFVLSLIAIITIAVGVTELLSRLSTAETTASQCLENLDMTLDFCDPSEGEGEGE